MSVNTSLQAINELRDALNDLLNVQNGPPLIEYEMEWTLAYNKAIRVLEETQWIDLCASIKFEHSILNITPVTC